MHPASSPYAPAGIAGRDTPPRPTPRWLVGCLGIFGLFAALIGLAVAVGTWWFASTGAQLDTLAAVGPSTQLAIHVRDDPESEGLNALLDRVGEHLGELDSARKRGRLPEEMRWAEELQQRRTTDADGLRLFLPSTATLAIDGPAAEPTALLVLNPNAGVRPIRALMTSVARPRSG